MSHHPYRRPTFRQRRPPPRALWVVLVLVAGPALILALASWLAP